MFSVGIDKPCWKRWSLLQNMSNFVALKLIFLKGFWYCRVRVGIRVTKNFRSANSDFRNFIFLKLLLEIYLKKRRTRQFRYLKIWIRVWVFPNNSRICEIASKISMIFAWIKKIKQKLSIIIKPHNKLTSLQNKNSRSHVG